MLVVDHQQSAPFPRASDERMMEPLRVCIAGKKSEQFLELSSFFVRLISFEKFSSIEYKYGKTSVSEIFKLQISREIPTIIV